MSRVPRVGVLWHAGSPEEEGRYYTGLVEGFRDLGYLDGRNIALEHRFPNETPTRFRSMATELVAVKVDVLIAVGTQTAPYAKEATSRSLSFSCSCRTQLEADSSIASLDPVGT